MNEKKSVFKNSTFFVILSLVLVYPIGVILMWILKKSWKLWVKILITVIAFLMLVNTIANPQKTNVPTTNNIATTTNKDDSAKKAEEKAKAEADKKAAEEKVKVDADKKNISESEVDEFEKEVFNKLLAYGYTDASDTKYGENYTRVRSKNGFVITLSAGTGEKGVYIGLLSTKEKKTKEEAIAIVSDLYQMFGLKFNGLLENKNGKLQHLIFDGTEKNANNITITYYKNL